MAQGPDDDFYEPTADDIADITGDDVDDVEEAWETAQDDYDQSQG